MRKRNELLAYIYAERPDENGITETWAISDHLMAEFSIPGFESFHKNRIHKRGGGVICFIKNENPAMKMSKQDSAKYDTAYNEVTTTRNNKLTIGTV